MSTYTEKQVKFLQPKVFAIDTENGQIQIKAYLKENAVKEFQKQEPSTSEKDVKEVRAFNSHQSSVDEIVNHPERNDENQWIDVYAIRYPVL